MNNLLDELEFGPENALSEFDSEMIEELVCRMGTGLVVIGNKHTGHASLVCLDEHDRPKEVLIDSIETGEEFSRRLAILVLVAERACETTVDVARKRAKELLGAGGDLPFLARGGSD
jgi:hypothetical protein